MSKIFETFQLKCESSNAITVTAKSNLSEDTSIDKEMHKLYLHEI